MRSCSKTACPRPAAYTCGFDYAQRLVWLSALSGQPDPSTYDLCQEHAASLRVPRGWSLVDYRPSVDQLPLLP